MRADVIVLGAGMVGLSAALHLQARGRSVLVVDRLGAPAGETSYGNSGIIEGSAFAPHPFPRSLAAVAAYALNRLPEANYHLAALPTIAPWLWRYFRASAPDVYARSANALFALVREAIATHRDLIAAAGAQALVSDSGWIKHYDAPERWAKAQADAEAGRALGLKIEALDAAALARKEPNLRAASAGALHYHDALAVNDPGGLGAAYARLFEARGGALVKGDAKTLAQTKDGWSVGADDGLAQAPAVVVALGPWAPDILAPLGYPIPFGVKRGYHMHFRANGNATLGRPVYSSDGGFVLSPMAQGIRMTTGAEFALRDAPPTPVQIDRTEALARRLFPLGERLDAEPWMGRRPCLPDMLPVIGAAPRHKGLWLDFGHQHLGLTLGPVSGRLLAEMMTGETPSLDPAPYRIERFS